MIAAHTPWPELEAMLDGMLARRWYTNHGPAARALEQALANICCTPHAVVVTNPAIGLVMMLEALNLEGGVLLSATAPTRCPQAIRWAGLDPIFCKPVATDGLDGFRARATQHGAAALLAVPAQDGPALPLGELAAAHGLAFCTDGIPAPSPAHPALLTLPAPPGWPPAACILTGDDAYAGRLRNIRSSYGAGPAVPVRRTANGRLSEVQAGLALLHFGEDATLAHTRPGP